MDLELQDQVAVVIGAAKGIGKAIAEAFSAERAAVCLADIDPAVEQSATSIAQETKGATRGELADATDYEAMQRLAERTNAELGPVRHLVYAAGCGSGKYGFPFWSLEPGDWEPVIRVNLLGAVNAAHAFAPHLVEQGGGTVLFLSSIAGQIGSQTDPPYSAAKSGLINFAQCAARDFASHNVRVNAICPGMVKTTVNRSVWRAWRDRQPRDKQQSYDDWAEEKIRRVSPLGRWQTCQDVANLAVFLASPRAENITGQTLNVDGGQVMHA